MTALIRFVAIFALMATAGSAAAARLEIPLRVSLDTLGAALNAQLTGYRDGPCRYLRLRPATLVSRDARLHLAIPARAALGVQAGSACQTATAWQGTIHFSLLPRIDSAGRVRVRVLDSRMTGVAPSVWDAARPHLHARLERFIFDLGASREALAALLREAAPAVDQMQVLQPRVEQEQVVVPITLQFPDAWLVAPPAASTPGTPLSEAEIAALESALEPWDAFLVYVIREIATDGDDSALRRRLFTLLLDSRYQLSALLAGEAVAEGDPLRALFLNAWQELRAILIDAQQAGALPASLLNYAMFVDAADALAALENAAPGLPLSVQGLRQLARSLRPGETADPLAYDWALDQRLGQLFEVEEIRETDPAPAAPAPKSWLDLFIARAYAEAGLDRWVPTRQELPAYAARVSALLHKTAGGEAQRTPLAAPYARVYQHLVPTTALIESCWRQYVVRGDKITYLRSQSSSVGIMQINQRVWRGFYDIERVRWDTAYNIRAGAQILMRYLKDYAIPYAEKTGRTEDVPRAAYAVYNAGPRAVGRFDKSPPHPREARVDEKLWSLYQAIAGGAQVDLASCGVKLEKPSTARVP